LKRKTILLVGSGHAHLEVVKGLSKKEILAHEFILISPSRSTFYSGLIPRFIAGQISENALSIRSAEFAESKGFRFIQDRVQAFDAEKKTVLLGSGQTLGFDVLSMNTGGIPIAIPSVDPSQLIYLRPFNEFIKKFDEVNMRLSKGLEPNFLVVGGGAAAVEVATALRLKLNKGPANNGQIHLVNKGPRLCESYSEKISKLTYKSLEELNIKVHLNESVDQIHLDFILLRNKAQIKFDHIFLATPTKPSSITNVQIDSTLRICEDIFAVGDVTSMKDQPSLPRSGVVAVHQGRHLVKSLRDVLAGHSPANFAIPKRLLNILITGENSARLIWGDLTIGGRWPLMLKNWIDQRYLKSFLKNN
jgi:NADH dehydrogenase FAD-containing subunit